MAELQVNYDEAVGGEPVPAGAYRVEVTGAQEAYRTQNTGLHRKVWTLTIASGDHAGETISVGYMLAGKGAGMFEDFVKACGAKPEKAKEATSDEDLEKLLIGKSLDVQVALEQVINRDTGEPMPDVTGEPRYRNEVTSVFQAGVVT